MRTRCNMVRIPVVCILLLYLLLFTGQAAAAGLHAEKAVFGTGELFVFRAMYYSRITGNVTAGDASLQIQSGHARVGNEPVMKIVGEANTRGMFNWFFKVENRYESYFHPERHAPERFFKNVREGRHRRNEDVRFDHDRKLAYTTDTVISIPEQVQDIISVFYYARTFDMERVRPGDYFEIEFYHRNSVHVTRIYFEGREQITTSLGTFNTLRFKPKVLEGQVFSQPYPMTLWISDDANKIPIRAESGLVLGSARLDLVEFGNLQHPVSSFVPDIRR